MKKNILFAILTIGMLGGIPAEAAQTNESGTVVTGTAVQVQPAVTATEQPQGALNPTMVSINLNELTLLKNAETELQAKIKQLDNEKQQAIADCKKQIQTKDQEIAAKNNDIKNLQKGILDVASNFLYVPYDEFNVNMVIKRYESLKETDTYKSDPFYAASLNLFKNYKRDSMTLLDFYKKNYADCRRHALSTDPWFNQISTTFNALPDVAEYSTNDFKGTYLGRMISKTKEAIAAKDGKNLGKLMQEYYKLLEFGMNQKIIEINDADNKE